MNIIRLNTLNNGCSFPKNDNALAEYLVSTVQVATTTVESWGGRLRLFHALDKMVKQCELLLLHLNEAMHQA